MSLFSGLRERLTEGLRRSQEYLASGLTAVLEPDRPIDESLYEELEELLIAADLGAALAADFTNRAREEVMYGTVTRAEELRPLFRRFLADTLGATSAALDLDHRPAVILMLGVNGSGKTTTTAKLAAALKADGKRVILAAADTFRAAAIEQLKIWAERTKSDIVSSKLGADAAGLAYEAFEQARLKKSDVLIIDTAGRLQNRTELMAELEKIVRVLGKLDPDAPHTVLQTLDATTGQNALNQVEIFRNIAGVNGLIMTKLDGTARGGILVAISAKHKLPVYFIGVGEGVDDLEPFEAKDFAEAIAGIPH
jgi:fused signal recognition particle receptor